MGALQPPGGASRKPSDGESLSRARGLALAETAELLVELLELRLAHVLEVDETGAGLGHGANQLVQLQLDGACVAVLRVLDMSRSVTTPRMPRSSQTGTSPQSCSIINAATVRRFVSGAQHTGSGLIRSFTFMLETSTRAG